MVLLQLYSDFACYLSYAASIDDILEEEEHFADQLKEYLFYTDAVRYYIVLQDGFVNTLIRVDRCSEYAVILLHFA